MQIGELAQLAQVSTRTIRHYHHVGLLPEPARTGGGYRTYDLRDVVRLFRARRLVELGLSLDEVTDALADDADRELHDILDELDTELAEQASAIAEKRRRIAALRSADTLAQDRDEALAAVTAILGDDHPSLERERLLIDLLEPLGADTATTRDAYRNMQRDDDLAEQMSDLSRRFEALADVAADDPEVHALAAEIANLTPRLLAAVPADAQHDSGDPVIAETLLTAAKVGMSPAQVRCLDLMSHNWSEAQS